MSDEQIKAVLRQAFIAVEKGFFQSLDDALAEKTELQLQMPEVHSKIIVTTGTLYLPTFPQYNTSDIHFTQICGKNLLMTSEHYQRLGIFAG